MANERTPSLAQRWSMLNVQQKAAIIFTGIVLAVGIAVAVQVAGAPKYTQLYGNLTREDAAAVVQKLKDLKVKYRIADGGATVEVPDDQVDELHLTLAGEGIPQGGNVGFELFDKPRIGQSEFSEHVNFSRALQGELERTIGQLESVRSARVHLVIPQNRIFVTDNTVPSASVVLNLRGPAPSTREVKAMIHLVASAVQGLTPDRVTIVDTKGALLSDRPELSGDSTLAVQEAQRTMEREMEVKLQDLLDRLLGPNKAMVRTSVTLSQNSQKITRENYTPVANDKGEGVLESAQITREAYNGLRAAVGGAAGIPPTLWSNNAGNGNANGGNGYMREENTSQYRVSKEVTEQQVPAGKIERVSIALFLDKSIDTEQVKALQQSVAAAAGIDAKRGDQVTAESFPFDTTAVEAEKQEAAADKQKAMTGMLTRYGGSLLIILLFIIVAASMYRRTMSGASRTTVADSAPSYPMLPPGASGERAVEQYALLDGGVSDAALEGPAMMPDTYQPQVEAQEEKAMHALEPQRVAAVIKSLMNEE